MTPEQTNAGINFVMLIIVLSAMAVGLGSMVVGRIATWWERRTTLLSSDDDGAGQHDAVAAHENAVADTVKRGETVIAMREMSDFTVAYVVKSSNGVETVKRATLTEYDLGLITALARLVGATTSGAHADKLRVTETLGLKIVCEVNPGKDDGYLIARAALKQLLAQAAAPAAERNPIVEVKRDGQVLRAGDAASA